jgi:hypothetical protein
MKLPSGIVDLTSLEVLDIDECVKLRWAVHTQSGRVDEFLNRTKAASLEDLCSLISLRELRTWSMTLFMRKLTLFMRK